MTLWRPLALALLGTVVAGGDSPPEFTAAGVARGNRPARMVVPGTFLTIYGRNLAPPPGQCGATYPVSTYPKEICGTRVLLGDMPAELLYVSDKQINFRVPQEAPQSGTVDIRVIYGQSSRPLAMKAGFEKTTVSLDGPAYAGMPVWLKIDLPFEWTGAVRYPFILGPAGFGCNEVQARRNGQMLPLLPGSNWTRYGVTVGGNICGSYSPTDGTQAARLPLHLVYRLDVPGVYEVRYTLRSMPAGFGAPAQAEFKARSEWTSIEVLPAKPNQRSKWLKTLRDRPPTDPAELLTDILPSLLGVPDDASFDILAGYFYHSNASVQRYALDGLCYWPEEFTLPKIQALLRTRGPNDALTRFLARQGIVAAGRR